MSAITKSQESPRIPWLFLGGYLVFFLGLAASLVGGFEFAKAPHDIAFPLALVGLGICGCAAGSLLMARSEQIRGCHMAGLIVCFVMTPIPALFGLGINFVGNLLRKKAASTLQVLLLGFGVFLLALAGMWFLELHQAGRASQEFRAVAWPFLADLGSVAVLLAALPMFLPLDLSVASSSHEQLAS
jgi:hypothetical protein